VIPHQRVQTPGVLASRLARFRRRAPGGMPAEYLRADVAQYDLMSANKMRMTRSRPDRRRDGPLPSAARCRDARLLHAEPGGDPSRYRLIGFLLLAGGGRRWPPWPVPSRDCHRRDLPAIRLASSGWPWLPVAGMAVKTEKGREAAKWNASTRPPKPEKSTTSKRRNLEKYLP